jgi:hypothetical protein
LAVSLLGFPNKVSCLFLMFFFILEE